MIKFLLTWFAILGVLLITQIFITGFWHLAFATGYGTYILGVVLVGSTLFFAWVFSND